MLHVYRTRGYSDEFCSSDISYGAFQLETFSNMSDDVALVGKFGQVSNSEPPSSSGGDVSCPMEIMIGQVAMLALAHSDDKAGGRLLQPHLANPSAPAGSSTSDLRASLTPEPIRTPAAAASSRRPPPAVRVRHPTRQPSWGTITYHHPPPAACR